MIFDLDPWFAHPALLAATAIVPVLVLLALGAAGARRRKLLQLASALSGRRLTQVRDPRRRGRMVLGFAGVLALAVACAGPQWGFDDQASRAPGADLAIVLDLSRSMLAEQPSRRDRAVRALRDLGAGLDRQGNCRVAMVAFAGKPRLLFPLTRDYDHFRHALAQVEADDIPSLTPGPEEPFVSGTRLGAALKLAVKILQDQASRARLILVLSDGDDPAADREWLEGAQAAAHAHIGVDLVGLGDAGAGHTIPDQHGVLHHAGVVVHTRLQEDVLQEIARRTGGVYLPARTDAIPLGALLSPLLAHPAAAEDAGRPVRAQRYAWFVAAALLLLILSMLLSDASRRRSAPPLAVALLAPLLLAAAPHATQSRALVHQGNECFKRRAYEEALHDYNRAQEQTDDPGLVAFNRAAALYCLGRYREAELDYRRCLEDDQAPADRRAQAAFGLGIALVRQGDDDAERLGQAVAAFRTCAKQTSDAELRADATHNVELTQLLWLKARAKHPEQPMDPESGSSRDGHPRNGASQQTTQKGEAAKGTPSRLDESAAGQQPWSKRAAAGALQALPDNDALVSLSPEATMAHLQRLAERIARQRRQERGQSHPEVGGAKDW